MEKNMNPCNDCIVDMICTQKCPNFEIDLERLQTDEVTYVRRCTNNLSPKTYQVSNNIQVRIIGGIRWFKNGKLHRDNDKPAVIHFSGSTYWYKNGEFHRDNDQPASIWNDGTKQWWKNGKLHRDNDKPSIIRADGTRSWYKNGVRYEPM